MTTTQSQELTVVLPALHAGQQKVADDPARFKIVRAGRRWGKTRLGVHESIKRGLQGGRAWWVAPTYKLAMEGWVPLRMLASYIPGAKVREADKEMWLPSGGRVGVRSADNPDMLRGAGLDYVVLDEAAYMVERLWYEILRPALADKQGDALFISTPAGYNWFYELWERSENLDSWSTFYAPSSDNPFIPEGELEEVLSQVGSHTYSQEFLAEFVELGGNVFKEDWFSYFREMPFSETHYDDDGEPFQKDRIIWHVGSTVFDPRQSTKFITVDPAFTTHEHSDYTAVAVCAYVGADLFVLDMYRAKLEGPDILPRVYALAAKWDINTIYLETGAQQVQLMQQAQRDGLYAILPLKADRDKFARAIPLAARMEAGKVHFLKGATWLRDLEKELLVFSPDPDRVKVQTDDQVDALAYAAIVMGKRVKWQAY